MNSSLPGFVISHFVLLQKAFSPVFTSTFCCPLRPCSNTTPSRKSLWTASCLPSLLEVHLLPCSLSPILSLELYATFPFLQQGFSDLLCVQSFVDEYLYKIQLKRKQFQNKSPVFFFFITEITRHDTVEFTWKLLKANTVFVLLLLQNSTDQVEDHLSPQSTLWKCRVTSCRWVQVLRYMTMPVTSPSYIWQEPFTLMIVDKLVELSEWINGCTTNISWIGWMNMWLNVQSVFKTHNPQEEFS